MKMSEADSVISYTLFEGEMLMPLKFDYEELARGIRLYKECFNEQIVVTRAVPWEDCAIVKIYGCISEGGSPWRHHADSEKEQGNSVEAVLNEHRKKLESLLDVAADLREIDVNMGDGSFKRALAALGTLHGHGLMPKKAPIRGADLSPVIPSLNEGPADKELESLIGLDGVKQQLREIAAYVSTCNPDYRPCMHMVFRGNPGTGKTTVARLVGRLFGEAGALKRPDCFIETDRSGLVASYVGQTANKTAEIVDKAMGGVLFIDEAYSLSMYGEFGGGSQGDKRSDFGDEAVSTLVKRMEDNRGDFVCIMAGYTGLMDSMIATNPGLRDRVAFYLDFPDYTAEELMQIFDRMCEEEDLYLDESAAQMVAKAFESIVANKPEDFSNGRIARKIFERVSMKQALYGKGNVVDSAVIEAAFSDTDLASEIGRAPVESVPFGFIAA